MFLLQSPGLLKCSDLLGLISASSTYFLPTASYAPSHQRKYERVRNLDKEQLWHLGQKEKNPTQEEDSDLVLPEGIRFRGHTTPENHTLDICSA
jgi:hypothetical protein